MAPEYDPAGYSTRSTGGWPLRSVDSGCETEPEFAVCAAAGDDVVDVLALLDGVEPKDGSGVNTLLSTSPRRPTYIQLLPQLMWSLRFHLSVIHADVLPLSIAVVGTANV